jgi:hypothetical protein
MLAVQLVTASYVHSFVFPPSYHKFLSGVVLSLKRLACGDRARGIGGMRRDGALREDCGLV